MTAAKFLMFMMLWLFVLMVSNVHLSNETFAICIALFCAGAIAKEEK